MPVSITEWMTLMEALDKGYIKTLDDFYFMARAILIKSESQYDHYDVAFQEYFKGIEGPADISDQIRDWLNNPLAQKRFFEDGFFKRDIFNYSRRGNIFACIFSFNY